MKNKRLLGIDYGSKRVGLALTDESGEFALPFSVIKNSDKALSEVLKICAENNVTKIVMGESKDFAQKDNPIMLEIKKFVHDLRNGEIEVVLEPEFMTSAQAERPIQSRRYQSPRINQNKKNDMLDASAAAIILQSFLDTKNNFKF